MVHAPYAILTVLLIGTLTAQPMVSYYYQVYAQTVIATVDVGDGPTGAAVNPTTNRIYVSNLLDDTVSVIDGTTNTVIATVGVGDSPSYVDVNPTTNRIYVTNFFGGTVSVIDGTTNTVIATVGTGNNPRDVAVNPTTNRIYLANLLDDTVSVIDGTTNTVIATVGVGDGPVGVDVNPTTNRIYVSNSADDTVSVIDGTTNTVIATVGVGDQPNRVDVNPTTNRIYVSNRVSDTVSVIDGTTNTVIATVGVGDQPEGVDVNPTTNRIYVSNQNDDTVSVIDGTTNTVIATVGVGDLPFDAAVNPTTNRIYIANFRGDTVSVIADGPIDVNQAPTANAGPDQTVNEGDTVTLDGTASSDADGTIQSYLWEQVITGNEPEITLSGANTDTATFTAPEVTANTAFTFNLTVTDNDGATAEDSVVVTVNNVNQAPTANAGADFSVDEGTTGVQLQGSGTDSDGNIASYLWEQTGGPAVTLSNADTATATFDAPSVTANTDLTFNLTVTDNDGATAEDSVVVTVNNVNQAPTANAGADFSVDEGTTAVQLDGSASTDSDGTIQSYLWEQTDGPPVTLNNADTATATFDAPSVAADTPLTFKLTVTDNDGATAEDSVVVTVNNVNQAPIAKLTANPTTIDEGKTSALDASGSTDPDSGDSLTYSFAILNSGPGTITGQTDSNDATATYNAPADLSSDQTVTIEVTVTDSTGASDTDTVQITVKNVPTATKKATLGLLIDPEKVKPGKTYTAGGALGDLAERKGLPGRTITVKTFDSSGNELTELTKTTTTAGKYGTYKVTMTAPSTPGKYIIQSFFDGDSEYKPAVSNKRTLTVR